MDGKLFSYTGEDYLQFGEIINQYHSQYYCPFSVFFRETRVTKYHITYSLYFPSIFPCLSEYFVMTSLPLINHLFSMANQFLNLPSDFLISNYSGVSQV